MTIDYILVTQNMSKYRLSQESGVPYATVNDLCNGKTDISNCKAGTLYKIAKALDVSMELLIEGSDKDYRCSFELFKSNVCHRLKELGDTQFLIETLSSNDIRDYYNKEWYPESYYLLAMLDYISRINEVDICEDYDDLRQGKLVNVIYPASIVAADKLAQSDEYKNEALANAIPEFLRFNIVENEVRSVI